MKSTSAGSSWSGPSADPIPWWQRVRIERELREWTPGQLAAASGLSRSLIGMVEAGRANPTLDSVARLAPALGMSAAELLAELRPRPAGETPPHPVTLVRGSEAAAFGNLTDREGRMVVLTPARGCSLELVVLDQVGPLPPYPGYSVHYGQECILVTIGAHEVVVEEQTYRLEAGDALTIDASSPHSIRSVSSGPSQFLMICTPPSF